MKLLIQYYKRICFSESDIETLTEFILKLLEFNYIDISEEISGLSESKRNILFDYQTEDVIIDHLSEALHYTKYKVTEDLMERKFFIFKVIYYNRFKGKWYQSFMEQHKQNDAKDIEDLGTQQHKELKVEPIETIKPSNALVVSEMGQLFEDTENRNPFIDYDNTVSCVIKDNETVLREMEIEETELAKELADRYTVDGKPLNVAVQQAIATGTLDSLRERLNRESDYISEHDRIHPINYIITDKIGVLDGVELNDRQTAFIIWYYSKDYNVSMYDVDLDVAMNNLTDELYQSDVTPIEYLNDLMDETYNADTIAEFEQDLLER